MARPSHLERTAAEPRHAGLHTVRLSSIRAINARIRLLTLSLPYALHFLPGQWLDVHLPGVSKAGGFTITSPPSRALRDRKPVTRSATATATTAFTREQPLSSVRESFASSPYVELAVQSSTANPPAAWLWQPESQILNSSLVVRIGGSFHWPPAGIDPQSVDELVLVAGGVGINPLISILTHLHEQSLEPGSSQLPRKVTLLYGSKLDPSGLDGVLFYPRLKGIMASSAVSQTQWTCRVFLTESGDTARSSPSLGHGDDQNVELVPRRMTEADILTSLPLAINARARAVAYVCGPARMTDHYVDYLQSVEGMRADRVLCERWW